ncbi:MAG: UDP-N-acetylmuramate dehydrogenase [Synergistaceae bacterium]|nr:UDP-N-acetylmuramate dehydrogenase [Synergistaceae bacterium]
MDFEKKLRSLSVGKISTDEPLKNHCSWRIGGPAEALVEPGTPEEAARLLLFAREEGLPLIVIGRGTNLLFSDTGVRGIVMKLGSRFAGWSASGRTVTVRSGLWVPRLVRNLAGKGLSGLEHAAGIPGSFGGLVTMNGGSLRRSISDNILSVTALSREGVVRRFSREECAFSYRTSLFQNALRPGRKGWIILEAMVECGEVDPAILRRELLRVLAERKGKFPLKQPNCGSVFTNSPEIYAEAGAPGKIVEETGLKELRAGDAQVSALHANFIVNLGGATARDVLTLMGKIRRRVHQRIGHWLASEVLYVDEEGNLVPASERCL